MRVIVLSAIMVGLVACGDDPAKTQTDTSTTETSEADATNATSQDSEDTSDVPVVTCNVGDTQTGTVGGEEFTLEVCGARIVVPAVAAATGTTVTLTAIEPPGAAPFERAFIGPVLEVTFSLEGDLDLPYALHILDVSADGGYRTMAQWVENSTEWGGFEACPETGGFLVEATFSGKFALFRDTVVFPESREGLGDGTLKSSIDGGEEVVWDTDVDGYAFHDIGPSGLKNVTVGARITPEGGMIKQLQIQLVEEADHTFTPIEATLTDTASTDASFSWNTAVNPPPSASSIVTVGGRIVGQFTVNVLVGQLAKPVTIKVDVSTERYRFPPDASCFPEG